MECKKIRILLSAYADQVLNPAEKEQVERHLAACTDCRLSLEDLERYLKIAGRIPASKAPANLRARVMSAIDRDKVPRIPNITSMSSTRKRMVAYSLLAAAIILAALWVISPNYFNTTYISTDISFQVIKKGKGPSENRGSMYDDSGEARLVRSIAGENGGRVVKEGANKHTGLTDYLTVRIKRSQYAGFLAGISDAGLAMDIPSSTDGMSRYVAIQVYFPGRKFFAGDFNHDGFDDLGTCFTRGKLAGEWYVSLNDNDSNFLQARPVTIHDTSMFLRQDETPLSGDFNGDGSDDLAIFRNDNNPRWLILINDRNDGFQASFAAPGDQWPDLTGGMAIPLTGDINGDGLADLVMHYRKGALSGQWFVALNNDGKGFDSPVRYPVTYPAYTPEQKYTPMLLDFNGDSFDDICLYWQAGELIARWYIGMNTKEGAFETPFQVMFGRSPRAYEGDYGVLGIDISGDGYDDMLVKAGTWDEKGPWYAEYNLSGDRFTYGMSISFGGEEDVIIKQF